jgi:transposase
MFFEEKEDELLMGTAVGTERFCDYNLGRSVDKILETGTHKIFSQLAQTALTVFGVDPRRLNFDTTSGSVSGDYGPVDPPFDITYGQSKDKCPDLKPFLVTMRCVDHNRTIVAHSSAHDKRRHKRIGRLLKRGRKQT